MQCEIGARCGFGSKSATNAIVVFLYSTRFESTSKLICEATEDAKISQQISRYLVLQSRNSPHRNWKIERVTYQNCSPFGTLLKIVSKVSIPFHQRVLPWNSIRCIDQICLQYGNLSFGHSTLQRCHGYQICQQSKITNS